MAPYPKADYSLRYDKHGVVQEINQISPLLTAKEYSIDEVDEGIRRRFPIMREAIEIARRFKYEMDIIISRALEIVIYHDFSECLGLPDLMRLFCQANLVFMDNHKRGKSVALTAIYLIID